MIEIFIALWFLVGVASMAFVAKLEGIEKRDWGVVFVAILGPIITFVILFALLGDGLKYRRKVSE